MRILVVIALLLAGEATAFASETTSYKYDTRGRLIEVKQQGGATNMTTTTYVYDAADNRTKVTVTSGHKVVVVPLNGFTVIPIN